MFDSFVAPLRCPACHSAVVDAEIQTHIRGASADGSALGVGAELDPDDLTPVSVLDAGYALVEEPAPDAPIRLLNTWICPTCQTEQWALIDIKDRRVASIEAVTLARETAGQTHRWRTGVLDVHDRNPCRAAVVCWPCFWKTNADQWILPAHRAALHPVVPYERLPLLEHRNPEAWDPALYPGRSELRWPAAVDTVARVHRRRPVFLLTRSAASSPTASL